jgi:hypothetical protein
MPDKPKSGKGSGLTRKLGPLPLWAWAAIGAVAGYFLWTKFLSGSAQPQQQQTAPGASPQPAPAPPLDTSGLGAATGGVDTSQNGQQDIANALGSAFATQTQQITGALTQSNQDLLAGIDQELAAYLGGAGGAATGAPRGSSKGNPTGATTTQTTTHPVTYHPVSARTSNFAAAAKQQSAALKKQGSPQPFGGVVSVHHNKRTGVTTTSYANGRVVSQAKGKSAYVARRGH